MTSSGPRARTPRPPGHRPGLALAAALVMALIAGACASRADLADPSPGLGRDRPAGTGADDGDGSDGDSGGSADDRDGGGGGSRDGDEDTTTSAAPTTPPLAPAARLQTLAQPGLVVEGADAATLAQAATQALFASAPVVALAPDADLDAQARAASLAVPLGFPVLLLRAPPAETAAPTPTTPPVATVGPTPTSVVTVGATTVAPAVPPATAAPATAAPTPTTAPAGTVDALAAELRRLGTQIVITHGAVPPDLAATLGSGITVIAAPADVAGFAALTGGPPPTPVTATPQDLVTLVANLTPGQPAASLLGTVPAPTGPGEAVTPLPARAQLTPFTGAVGLADRIDGTALAAVATARAAGLPIVGVDGGDPRATPEARAALSTLKPQQVVALGVTGRFPAADSVRGLVATAAGGLELPGGGQIMFPARRLVALYGHPGDTKLGALGEQSLEATVTRAQELAASYQPFSAQPVIPTFEIITTIASSAAGPDGDFSLESDVALLKPWIDAATANGMYVVLDLQPGFTDFLTQAKRYEELLALPNVGLALDPEWRLAPGQKHMRDIGSVGADEVNSVVAWLSGVVRDHGLPQKLLVLHQFRLDMIANREQIVVPPELAVMFHMDGLGSQSQKDTTWAAVSNGAPAGVWFGWKNFYDEDSPLRSPQDTVAVQPSPLMITYQ